MQLTEVRAGIISTDIDTEGALDVPDCLAELEFCYSVFRFRHEWGTLYEVTLTNLADGEDRLAAWALLPQDHLVVDSLDTDTMGVGDNGIVQEVTHRVISAS